MKARRKTQDRPRGILRHIGLPDTVASFRTWRGFRAPIAQSPKACALSGFPLKRREWDSNPRWSYPHTRFPSVLLKPLGHLSRKPSDSTISPRRSIDLDMDRTGCAFFQNIPEVCHQRSVVDAAKSRGILFEL